MAWLILALPWALYGLLVPFALRRRPRLRDAPVAAGDASPLVSVIVPARDEAENIAACMTTILASRYPRRELIVVDDRSGDGTLEIARVIAARSAAPVQVIDGLPLPDGWVGKPWACWQAATRARGELLAFTDADTRHDDELLGRAVGALLGSGADLLSVAPRQRMVGFWERLLLPHVFVLLWLRWRDPAAVQRVRRPTDAVAGGQFLLVRRAAYEAAGGHAAVRAEVVEDLALAQRVVRAGGHLYLALAEELIETRMYRSLREIVDGWSRSLAAGSRLSVAPALRPLAPWALAAFVFALWVVPPLLLIPAVFGAGGAPLFDWAAVASAAGLFFWIVVRARYRAHPLFALLFPLGATIIGALLVRSAGRGARFSWKGRVYGPDLDRGAHTREA